MTIYVSSTTGTQQDVDDAANYDPDAKTKEGQPSADSGGSPELETAAEPDAAEEPESTEEEEGPEEEERPEEEEPPEVARGPGTHKRLMRRLNELFEQRLTLREELDAVREENRRLKEGKGAAEAAPPAGPQPLRRPDPSDAKYKGRPYEEFVEDLADFKVKERELVKAQQDHEAFVRGIFDDYNQQVEVARGNHEDFDEVVGKDVQVPVIAINAMYELDNGPEVAYYLGKHPEVREQLLDWNEPGTKGGMRRIVVELDRISSELAEPSSGRSTTPSNGRNTQSSPKPESRTRSATPPPIKPLGGASAAARSNADPGNMDYQSYKRWFQKTYGTR